MGATGLPVVEHSGGAGPIDPEVALGGATVFPVEVIDRAFIHVDVIAFSDVGGDDVVEWLECVCTEFSPIAEGRAGNTDTTATFKDLALPEKRKVVVVFGCENVGKE